jgi:hypothetical protein
VFLPSSGHGLPAAGTSGSILLPNSLTLHRPSTGDWEWGDAWGIRPGTAPRRRRRRRLPLLVPSARPVLWQRLQLQRRRRVWGRRQPAQARVRRSGWAVWHASRRR